MGTGIPAAMFAAIFRSLVRAMPELTHKPSELLTRVNYQMSNELSEVEMFITAQLVFVDARKRRLIAAGAGHCPILLANNSETLPKRISPEGMPLGILPTTYFSGQTVPLGNFSRVLLYTDGVTEARNEQGEFFGLERLIQWLNKTSSMQCTAQELKEELLKELRKFQSGLPLRDDQAFLILAEERHGK
ncbi:MAG: serine/threonine-protein phosphatase, partial [Verrucomicrobia bacterium]|nr:serine/threonine-protein phosphatase [Verrucomicrobiota bacterium]